MELSMERPLVQQASAGGATQAEMIKSIHKARLQRQVLADPSLAAKLVAVESTATYNARGDLVQAVGGNLGEA